ncbi:DUF4268 domain-containing protein [Arenibacter sp. GZD96]|uniref:DUF4268 domain-containing protein n=1 Tax=Aurantibrevibacter litoralis TaxID=3106030 RepID=UPI002AFEDA28|nr:DUF4268 domain-containing protein [Arenibacter sp. GZD-96]MEA1785970.1 DUF4268 domain-containing protein [Arenibacter sp. GZD-96]
MFSKEVSKVIRQEFWVSYGKAFPRKWIRYDTKIKDVSLKFYFDTRNAAILLDIEDSNPTNRRIYFQKLEALKGILHQDYLPDAVYEEHCILENGKEISRISVTLTQVSIHDKNTWQRTMVFLHDTMDKLEQFWLEYAEFIKT